MIINILKKRILLLVLCTCFNTISKGQENIKKTDNEDSLEEKINKDSKYQKELSYLKLKRDSLSVAGSFSDINSINQDLLSLAETHKDTLNLVDVLYKLSNLNLNDYKYDEAEKYALRIDYILKDRKNKEGYYLKLADSKMILSSIYTYTDKPTEAFENVLLANEYYLNVKDQKAIKKELILNYMFLAEMYRSAGDDLTAIEIVENALKLYNKDSGLESELSDCYIMLGVIYGCHNDTDKAISNTEKALEVATASSDTLLITNSFLNLGIYLMDINAKTAANYFKKTLTLAKNNDIKKAVIDSYNFLSKIHMGKGNHSLAIKYVDSALALNKHGKYYSGLNSYSLISKSKCYEANNQPDFALKYLNKNLDFVQSENMTFLLAQAYEQMYQFYNDNGDFLNCKLFYDKYNATEEENEAKSNRVQLELLKVSYRYRETSAKLENEKIALQLSDSKQKRIKARSYFVITIIIITTLFIMIVFIKQKKQVKAEKIALEAKQQLLQVEKTELDEEVKFKNKSVTNFALQINEKNKLLKDLKSKLKRIKPANNGSKIMMLDLMIQINNDIDKDEEKVALYLEANQKNDQFEQKINELFTDLTEKEKKIITKLRLGERSKEIAQHLNITKASVDNYRYLIRKKMNIPKGVSLDRFIKNI